MLKCISQYENEVIGIWCGNNFSKKIFVFFLEPIVEFDFCMSIFQPELSWDKYIVLTEKIIFFMCLFCFIDYEEQ